MRQVWNHDDMPTTIRPVDSSAMSVPANSFHAAIWQPLETARFCRKIHSGLFSFAFGGFVYLIAVMFLVGPDSVHFKEYIALAVCTAVMASTFSALWIYYHWKESSLRRQTR